VALNFGTDPLVAVMVHGVGGKYGNGGGTVRRISHGRSSLGVTSVGGKCSQTACALGDGIFLAGLRCRMLPSARMWSAAASERRWWLWAGGGNFVGVVTSSGSRADTGLMPVCANGRW